MFFFSLLGKNFMWLFLEDGTQRETGHCLLFRIFAILSVTSNDDKAV